jgi:hypothetical protein
MPTVASWPTSIGQDRRHRVEISVRTGEAVLDGEVVLVMSVWRYWKALHFTD